MSGENFEEKLTRFRNMPEYGSQFHSPYAVRSTLGFSIEAQEVERLAILEGEKTNFSNWNFNAAQNVIGKWLRQSLQNPAGIFDLERIAEQIHNKPLWLLKGTSDDIQNEIERVEDCEKTLRKLCDEITNDPNFAWNKSYFLQRVAGEGSISEGFNIGDDREGWLLKREDEFLILTEQKSWFNEVLKIIQKEVTAHESHKVEVLQKAEAARKIIAEAEKLIAKINEITKLPEARNLSLHGFTFKRAEEFMELQGRLDSLQAEFNAACGDRAFFSDFAKPEPMFPNLPIGSQFNDMETRSRIKDFYNREIAKRKK